MSNKKEKKSYKEVWKEAKEEGLFSEAKEMARGGRKKYKFNSFIDGIISIAIIILAVVIISWIRRL